MARMMQPKERETFDTTHVYCDIGFADGSSLVVSFDLTSSPETDAALDAAAQLGEVAVVAELLRLLQHERGPAIEHFPLSADEAARALRLLRAALGDGGQDDA